MSGGLEKILVVGYTENPGGIETLMQNVISATDPACVRFDFLANCPKVAFEEKLLDYGASVYHITPRRKSRTMFYRDLDAVLAAHAGEYAAIWENMNSLANIDYLVRAKRFGIPERIMHCHNAQNTEGIVRGALHAANRRRVRKVATRFWSVSDTASEWFYGADFASLPGYRVVSNAIDVAHYAYDPAAGCLTRRRYGIPQQAIVLGNVGRLHSQKNQALVLDVAARLACEGLDVCVLIVGRGELEAKLRAQAEQLQIVDRVVFTGAVDDAAPLYSAMDLFFFPSLVEGLSIALLEAQSNGLPCLVSDGVPKDGQVNNNVVSLALDSSLDAWVAAAHGLIVDGRTRDIKLRGSRFDLPSIAGLFDWLGEDSVEETAGESY